VAVARATALAVYIWSGSLGWQLWRPAYCEVTRFRWRPLGKRRGSLSLLLVPGEALPWPGRVCVAATTADQPKGRPSIRRAAQAAQRLTETRQAKLMGQRFSVQGIGHPEDDFAGTDCLVREL